MSSEAESTADFRQTLHTSLTTALQSAEQLRRQKTTQYTNEGWTSHRQRTDSLQLEDSQEDSVAPLRVISAVRKQPPPPPPRRSSISYSAHKGEVVAKFLYIADLLRLAGVDEEILAQLVQ